MVDFNRVADQSTGGAGSTDPASSTFLEKEGGMSAAAFMRRNLFARVLARMSYEADPSRNIIDLRPPPYLRPFHDVWNKFNDWLNPNRYAPGMGPNDGFQWDNFTHSLPPSPTSITNQATKGDYILPSGPNANSFDALIASRMEYDRRRATETQMLIHEIPEWTVNKNMEEEGPVNYNTVHNVPYSEDLERENNGRGGRNKQNRIQDLGKGAPSPEPTYGTEDTSGTNYYNFKGDPLVSYNGFQIRASELWRSGIELPGLAPELQPPTSLRSVEGGPLQPTETGPSEPSSTYRTNRSF